MEKVFHVSDNGIIKSFRGEQEFIKAYPNHNIKFLIEDYEKEQEKQNESDLKRKLFLKDFESKINKFNKKYPKSEITKDILEIYLNID